jgi:hypothetical protein
VASPGIVAGDALFVEKLVPFMQSASMKLSARPIGWEYAVDMTGKESARGH